jgi:mono/diheme cytochrome c family protein
MRFLQGFVVALILLAIAAIAVAYSGAYNVAASVPEPGVLQWFLSTTMEHSVKNYAQSVAPRTELSDQQARDGLRIYGETCVFCHGGPGQKPGDVGMGLNPKAPYLPDTVARWDTAQLFWIIKNGIKMTAMASYGITHNDEEIWTLAAFVQRLPHLTPEEYKQMKQEVAPAGR